MTTTPLPPFQPRRPYDDDQPDGYLESDNDFVENNMELVIALLGCEESRSRADLEAENARLREALAEAADDIESWGAYADVYFQKKHDLQGAANKARTALKETP